MHVSVAMTEQPVEFLNVIPVNPLISKCQIKVCYVGDEPNRNRSIISKDTARDLANSLPGSPIVGLYNEEKGDFESHSRELAIKDGQLVFEDKTRPYGFVSMDARVWFEWFRDDGVPHEYLMTEGYIWTGQYPESKRIITEGNNQSMELDENFLDASWTKDNNGKPQFFIINEAIMSKLCILGNDVEPCFEGASITNVQFSFEDGFKNQLFSMITEMQEILKEGGTTPVFTQYAVEIGDNLWTSLYSMMTERYPDTQGEFCSMYSLQGVYEEGDQKFAVLENRRDNKLYRVNFSLNENEVNFADTLIEITKDFENPPQFALADVEAYEASLKEPEAQVEEPVVDEPAPDVVDEPVNEPAGAEEPPVDIQYNLEEIPEYVELRTNYAALEARIAELESANQALTSANEALTQFKLEADRKDKQELINSFYMLSDEDKKDCLDNIDTYSRDDIEAKLSIICVRNKVSFDLEDDNGNNSDPHVFNLDSVDNNDDGEVPAWVKRVQQVAKDKNI